MLRRTMLGRKPTKALPADARSAQKRAAEAADESDEDTGRSAMGAASKRKRPASNDLRKLKSLKSSASPKVSAEESVKSSAPPPKVSAEEPAAKEDDNATAVSQPTGAPEKKKKKKNKKKKNQSPAE